MKQNNAEFCFMAEVYWNREWDLQQLGFDYCYDKTLYDRLLHDSPRSIHLHWLADSQYQQKLVRFLENHDEPRIASRLSKQQHFAAAILCYLSEGLKFFHEGQLEGRQLKISPHVTRRWAEAIDVDIESFYMRLLKLLNKDIFEQGRWMLIDPKPAWDGDPTFENILAFRWKDPEFRHLLVIVNYSSCESQARVRLSIDRNCVSHVHFEDCMSGESREFHRGELFNPECLSNCSLGNSSFWKKRITPKPIGTTTICRCLMQTCRSRFAAWLPVSLPRLSLSRRSLPKLPNVVLNVGRHSICE